MTQLTTRDLLAALQLPGVGPSTVRKLYEHSVSNLSVSVRVPLLDLLSSFLRPGLVPPTEAIVNKAYDEADEILSRSYSAGVLVFSPLDKAYPRSLLDLPDYPPIVHVKGSLSTLGNPMKLAVVGTRHASELGLRLARKIAAELSSLKICVVSGLALGVDTAAHEGALNGSGSTIAVLAHGLDQVAPKANEGLAARILEKNGVLFSEYEIGVAPRPPQFVFRNRLQSGLSRGSVVVESGFSGGSIHQGKFTSQQRRLLFVVTPEPILPGAAEFKREGAERLQREFKAKPVTRLEDILESLPEFRSVGREASTTGDEARFSGNASSRDPSQSRLFE